MIHFGTVEKSKRSSEKSTYRLKMAKKLRRLNDGKPAERLQKPINRASLVVKRQKNGSVYRLFYLRK